MQTGQYTMFYDSYEICKKFHTCIPCLTNYLVRKLGIDTEPEKKTTIQKVRHGKTHLFELNKKSHRYHANRTRRKKRTKRKHHAEPV